MLNSDVKHAQQSLYEAMSTMFPEGSDVFYMVRRGQTEPSCGQVIGAHQYQFAGYLNVRPYSGKREIRSVHFSKICRWDWP
jgi:Ca2+/Na+ antiporter